MGAAQVTPPHPIHNLVNSTTCLSSKNLHRAERMVRLENSLQDLGPRTKNLKEVPTSQKEVRIRKASKY